MNKVLFSTLAAIVVSPLSAQVYQRRASLVGNSNSNEGKCTIEVVVDGAAEVEIRGDSATLRNLAGQPPQWRRFQCNTILPPNPANFRFQGIDGRGRQELVNDPRNGGPAVVRIEDPDSGSEGYTFDILWSGGSAPGPYGRPGPNGGADRYDERRGFNSCQDAVRRRSEQMFGTPQIEFQDIRRDPDGDRISGTFFLGRDRDRDQPHRFSCALDFERDEVRDLVIDPNRGGGFPGPERGDNRGSRAVDNCRAAVDQRLRREGYRDIQFSRINANDNPGGNDSVVGTVRADRGSGDQRMDFSCRVNLERGEVYSVDLNRTSR